MEALTIRHKDSAITSGHLRRSLAEILSVIIFAQIFGALAFSYFYVTMTIYEVTIDRIFTNDII